LSDSTGEVSTSFLSGSGAIALPASGILLSLDKARVLPGILLRPNSRFAALVCRFFIFKIMILRFRPLAPGSISPVERYWPMLFGPGPLRGPLVRKQIPAPAHRVYTARRGSRHWATVAASQRIRRIQPRRKFLPN